MMACLAVPRPRIKLSLYLMLIYNSSLCYKVTRMENQDSTEFWTLEQAGRLLKASRFTMMRWLKEGRLPATKIGRRWLIPKNEVHKMMRASVRYPKTPEWKNALTTEELSSIAREIGGVLALTGASVNTGGVLKLITGEAPIDPDFWRTLGAGLQRLKMASA